MDTTDTCRDLTFGALTSAESQTMVPYESFQQAVVETLRERGHHVVATTVDTPEGRWTAVACDSTDGYVIRTYGPTIDHDQQWHEEPLLISRHNAVEQFLRYLRQARVKPLLDHLDANIAYRELFADEYRAICAVVVDAWWQARMAEGYTFESAQMLLALTLPIHLQRPITYERGTPAIS